MFEVRIMCEDSKLHKVLWALDGLIVGQPQMLPVRNAAANKDKTQVKEKIPHGSLTAKMMESIRLNGSEFMTWKDVAELMEHYGGSRTATSAYIKRFQDAGLLKKVSTGKYKIVRE